MFGYFGAMAYQQHSNLFDDLFFSQTTPFNLIIATFISLVRFKFLRI